MNTVKLSEVLGDSTLYYDEGKAFFANWFQPEEKINISLMEAGVNRPPKTHTCTLEQLLSFSNDDLNDLVFAEGKPHNVYFQVAPTSVEIKGIGARGKEVDVTRVPGVWADFDVKDGAFASPKDIWEFLFSLEIWPTAVIGGPSGGMHAYWKLAEGSEGSKELLDRWWAYLDETAGEERRIDKLIDTARILRIPGSLYFPKTGSKTLTGAMRLYHNSGDTTTPEEIVRVSEAAYNVKRAMRKKVVDRDFQRKSEINIQNTLFDNGPQLWQRLQALAHLEDDINQNATWDDILPKHGWTYIRDAEDCRWWARPGRSDKSATTDYVEHGKTSPVMSLFSSSEETGLSDLFDAGMNLTKYRVILRLDYQDNEQAMIDDYLRKYDPAV
jgi:hypothetical protein